MEFDVGYLGAGLAGLASFLTPCILPIVPFYLCYISGVSFEQLTSAKDQQSPRQTRIILSAIAFSLGMVIVFVGLGAVATTFGQQVRAYSDELRWLAAAIILILGLHYLGIFRIAFLMREARFQTRDNPAGLVGATLVGMAFAFGWTPCAGPILAVILFQAADASSSWHGMGLLLAYGLGMVLPFILAAFFIGPFLAWAKGFRRHLQTVERGIGVMLIVFAILIATNSINEIANWMLQYAPDLGLL